MDSSSHKKKIRQLASPPNENQVQQLLKLHEDWQLDKVFDMIQNRPGIVDIFHVQKFLEEPVEPYLSDLEIRRQLLERVTWIATEVNVNQDIHMALFAVFMVAPVDNLQSKVEMLEISFRDNNQTAVEAMLTQWRQIWFAGTQAFVNKESRRSEGTRTENDPQSSPAQKRQKQRWRLSQQRLPSNSSDTPESSCSSQTLDLPSQTPQAQGLVNKRAVWAEKLCKQRDGGICYFAGMPDPVTAHIFPLVDSNLSDITSMVQIFWGADSANRLSTLMAGDKNISESPKNLISMNRQLHCWYKNGRMALKPLRRTGNLTTVQFHWLEPSRSSPDTSIRGACFTELTDRVGHFPTSNGAHQFSGVPLSTGHVFTFWDRVDQSWNPNFDLLQLSWDLRRVATICGAYREPEDESPDDEGEYSVDDEGHDDDEDCDDNDGVNVDAHLRNWQENQNAVIHQWMGEVEVESGNQVEEKASN